jgi:hypothetical protein
MIRAGHDFEAKLSTGTWLVIVETDCKGVTLAGQSMVIYQKDTQSRDYADTCIHECLHASDPDMSEDEVARIANDITEVMWKRGYRLPKPPKRSKKDAS